jgi:hypothetical protein
MLHQIFGVLLLGSTCFAGQEFIFVENNIVYAEKASVLRMDVFSSQPPQLIAKDLSSDWDFVSGSVQCGNFYYTIGVSEASQSIVLVKVNTSAHSGAPSEVVDSPRLLHALACNAQDPNVLYVVYSVEGPTFVVGKMDTRNGSISDVASLPTPNTWCMKDSIFFFQSSPLRLYTSFPINKHNTLFVVDLPSGIISSYLYPSWMRTNNVVAVLPSTAENSILGFVQDDTSSGGVDTKYFLGTVASGTLQIQRQGNSPLSSLGILDSPILQCATGKNFITALASSSYSPTSPYDKIAVMFDASGSVLQSANVSKVSPGLTLSSMACAL